MFAVTFAAGIIPATPLMAQVQGPIIQYGGKVKVDKGPRAIGLVQLPSKGKPRLIPIAIMLDGKFYDADSYKAAPVPMALDFGVVYEAFHEGISQGLFTITQPGQLNHTWIAEGTWLNAAAAAAQQKKKKYTPPVVEDDDSNGPPVLHRRKGTSDDSNKSPEQTDKSKDNDKDNDKDKNKDANANSSGANPSSPTDKAGADTTNANADNKDQQASQKQAGQKQADQKGADGSSSPPSSAASRTPVSKSPISKPAEKPADSSEQIEDPNRPRLRRGAPVVANVRSDVYAKFEALPSPSVAPGSRTSNGSAAKDPAEMPQVTAYVAVSDAAGPDPRAFVYDIKPAEEATYRTKMLALAAAQFHAPADTSKTTSASAKKSSAITSSKKTAAKTSTRTSAANAKPDFDDVTLHIFDLSNSNEPILILSAKTQPHTSGSSENAVEPKEITLIARTNLEGELKKLFFSKTDSHHLDESPRMELVDALDADGDGRGELLFRRTFDNGSAYAIYRVSVDRLWPLFEGRP
jgi:hypothetical protein